MIRLPTFTLLTGPNGSGKSTLAQLLQRQDEQLCPMSFAEPIRLALLAAFHPEEMTFGLDLRSEDVKSRTIPGGTLTYREWMIRFGDWMKDQFTPYIFADLAKRTIESQRPYWQRFIFDDMRFAEEVGGIAAGYGAQNVLVVHLERGMDLERRPSPSDFGVSGNKGTLVTSPSFPLPSIRRLVIRNDGEPLSMLLQMSTQLGEWNPQSTPLKESL